MAPHAPAPEPALAPGAHPAGSRARAREAARPYPERPAGEALRLPAPAPDVEIGVRELRDHLSRYLVRVKAGEELTVTEHGRPNARLGAPRARDRRDELVAQGLIRPALHPATDIDLDSLPEIPGFSLSEYLISLRDAEYEAMNRGHDDVSRRLGDRQDPPAGG
jgi:antitoxin (DNA-binding transcriptional repressor) of toxin-antitoxin stability system